MRKRYGMVLLLSILLCAGLFYLHDLERNSVVLQAEGGIPFVDVNMQQSTNQVSLWQDRRTESLISSCAPVWTTIM